MKKTDLLILAAEKEMMVERGRRMAAEDALDIYKKHIVAKIIEILQDDYPCFYDNDCDCSTCKDESDYPARPPYKEHCIGYRIGTIIGRDTNVGK
jgi:hypothetical protein